HRSGVGDGPGASAPARLAADRRRTRHGRSLSGHVHRGSMALRELSDDSARAKLVLRNGVHGLQHSPAVLLCQERILLLRIDADAVLARHARRHSHRVFDDVDRHSRRATDAEGETMRAPRSWAIAAIVAATLIPRSVAAHIGSPDVFLDGEAGPYRVFVTVR